MMRNLIFPAALLAAAALLGCSGLDDDNDSLPAPAIFDATGAASCGTAGTTPIELTLTSVRVLENVSAFDPVLTPLLGQQRVEVSGFATGLPAGQSVYGIVLDDAVDCPPTFSREVTAIGADGSFVLLLRISTANNVLIERFRVVAVTGPAGATVACGTDCLQLDAGGTTMSVGGISNAIGVRL